MRVFIMLALLSTAAFSQSIMEVLIGGISNNIDLGAVSKITFTSTDMVVQGAGKTFAIDDIRKITFHGGQTAVRESRPAPWFICNVGPNPCNPSTMVSLTLPADAQTDISIYNQAGAKVKSLVSGRLTAGRYRIVWDGTDHNHGPVASGLYIMTIQYNSRTMNKKIVLLK
jgi:hypothetical protein